MGTNKVAVSAAILAATVRGIVTLAASPGGASRPGEPHPYGTCTTTLKNRIAAFSVAVAPSTAFLSPSSLSAPFNTACISALVQRFTLGSHSTFGLPSTISREAMRETRQRQETRDAIGDQKT